MPFPFIPIAAAAWSAGLTALGADNQNEANAEQAELNRQFQERMSNTQYQRAVKDMRAAGLNPALAYQQGGASSPTGSSAPPMQNTFQGASTALSTLLQLRQMEAQTENIDMDTHKKQTEAQALQYITGNEVPNIIARTELAIAQKDALDIENRQRAQQLKTALEKAVAEKDLTQVKINAEKLNILLGELGIPEAKASAEFYRGIGKYTPYVGGVKQLIDMLPGSLLDHLGPERPAPSKTVNIFRKR